MLLICWVCGDPHAFSIEISPEKIVEVKRAIVAQNPNRFRGIDAYSLALWKKILPEEDRNKLELSDLGDELHVTWSIGKYFEEPPKETIHTVIKAPKPLDVESKLHD